MRISLLTESMHVYELQFMFTAWAGPFVCGTKSSKARLAVC